MGLDRHGICRKGTCMGIERILDLKIKPRGSGYQRGRSGHEQILRAALDVLLEEGFPGLTLRSVARICNMRVGNVTYYFPAKEDLVQELLESIISAYEDEFEKILSDENINASDQFDVVCELIMADLSTRRTTIIFPELWNFSNRDPFILERMNELYKRSRVVTNKIISRMRPDLGMSDVEILSIFIQASMEGHTIFVGSGRQFEKISNDLTEIAKTSFKLLIRNYKRLPV